MADYKDPRPSPTASSADPCVIYDNAVSFDKVVNGDSAVTTYTGKSLVSLSQALDGFGFGVAGFTFTDGGTLDSLNLLVSNSPDDGYLYKYVGAGSAPITVAAGTDPTTDSDWQSFSATSHNLLSDRSAVGAHDAIYRRETTVAEIATGVFSVGDKLTVTDRANVSFDVVSGGVADGYGVLIAGAGKTAALVSNGYVSPAMFGAVRGQTGQQPAIQACFDYAQLNDIQVTGDGKYYTASPLSLSASFSSVATMTIEPIVGFSGADMIKIDRSGLNIYGLLTRNGNAAPNITGIHIAQPEVYMSDSGGIAFERGILVGSYSVTLDKCKAINGKTGLSAYGSAFTSECNALIVNGGEYFGNSDYSMYLGDSRLASVIPSNEFFGNKITINGPTCDQGKIKVDRLIDVSLFVYCEKGGGAANTAVEAGGSFSNSVRGLDVKGFFTDYDYVVKCLGAVSGINLHDSYFRTINKCALYLTSQQFKYRYTNNTSVSSFASGQAVHTGVQSGVTGNAWEGNTIDVYDLFNGSQSTFGEHIYPSKSVYNAGVRYSYPTQRYRYYKSTAFTAACTISGNTVTLNTPTEINRFNGGDAVVFSGTGGALTYILSVDYDSGTMKIESYAFSGAGNISQQTFTPRAELTSFQTPTLSGVSDGSVAWNTFTSTATPNYWIRKSGAWVAG